MFRPGLRAGLVLILALVVSAAVGSPPASAAGGRISVTGTQLSRDGKFFTIYGATVYPSGGIGWKDGGFRSYLDGRIADARGVGLNTLRITDFIDGVTSDVYDPAVWGNIDYALEKAAADNIVVILDLSTYRNHLKDVFGVMPYRVADWIGFLDFVGNRYRDNAALAYVALAGEPDAPLSSQSLRPTTAQLTDFYRDASSELHRVAPRLLISSGGLMQLDWDSGIDWQTIFSLPNILPAVHAYSSADVDTSLPRVSRWAAQHDKPLILKSSARSRASGTRRGHHIVGPCMASGIGTVLPESRSGTSDPSSPNPRTT